MFAGIGFNGVCGVAVLASFGGFGFRVQQTLRSGLGIWVEGKPRAGAVLIAGRMDQCTSASHLIGLQRSTTGTKNHKLHI